MHNKIRTIMKIEGIVLSDEDISELGRVFCEELNVDEFIEECKERRGD